MNNIINEIENMKLCENKYSVKFYKYFKNENIMAIVMELCDNNLSNILRNRNEGFSIKEIYEIMSQLNQTFKIMRNNGIVHRDLKLENILIKYEENNILNFVCKLTDYGISKKMNDFEICKTYTGTAITMAPEILKNEGVDKEYDEKCDLWSIGVIIYELYFKRPPFSGNNEISIFNSIKSQGKRQLKKTGCYQLDDLIEKLLIEDPIKRLNWDEYFNHSFFKDEIIITYKSEGKKEIKILGKQFEEKNKNICYIIYKNKEYRLSEYFKVEEINENIEIKIIGINRINDASYMFYKCSSLLNIDNLSKWNTSNINDMSYMSYECSSLKNISDISKWDTSKVKNMSNMFAKCSSLSLIHDISQWNMSNVNNIRNMFNECKLLQTIPNIYNLNNNKTINIEDSLEPISIEITKKIIEQLENNIYEINIGDNNKYIGIFCKIPYLDNLMNILIINKAIINIDKIKVLINNKYKEIKIEKRRKYINKKYDITIIEIHEKLKINYMEYNENILNINKHKLYINKTIYTLQFADNKNKYISYGKIEDINENYYYYKCNNKYSVLPILDILNNKIIGINIKSDNNNSKGIFMNYIIDEFIINEFEEKYNLKIKKRYIEKFEKTDILKIIKNEDLKFLNYFKELKELNLSNSNISDIKILEKVKFEKLEKLDLSENKLSDINILEKVNFKELKELNLYNISLPDIKVLEKVKFEKLEKLIFSGNKNLTNIVIYQI